ncbi:MAG: hypothetical protein HYZ11_10970 [Candidatus Tectomicrobia bacterium]|uniref:Cupin domain-containing protein n=1 Tax=Tectimicrobiota bacterium TaxID=2528274 RepID=A0A932HYU3_UNCTE|nr:hypothetical protein [Candidatus Tectomicrobia bacterium]
MAQEIQTKGVEYLHAKDGRTLALVIRGDFDDYAAFPPYLDTPEERAHLAAAYQGADPETERRTKAHMTADELPLQIVLLNRNPGAVVKPHYHLVTERPSNTTRHQIMICRSGRMRINIFSKEGDKAGSVVLEPGDLVLMYEGHSIEFLLPNTKAIEIKEGPFPITDEADKVEYK